MTGPINRHRHQVVEGTEGDFIIASRHNSHQYAFELEHGNLFIELGVNVNNR